LSQRAQAGCEQKQYDEVPHRVLRYDDYARFIDDLSVAAPSHSGLCRFDQVERVLDIDFAGHPAQRSAGIVVVRRELLKSTFVSM
jgi:hypothetical protein